jgi:hypothetical protein
VYSPPANRQRRQVLTTVWDALAKGHTVDTGGAYHAPVRRIMDLLGLPLLGLVLLGGLTLLFAQLGQIVDARVDAFMTAIGVWSMVAAIAYQRSSSVRYWIIRLRARLGRGFAPSWKLSVGLRARVGPDEGAVFEERVRKRLPLARLDFTRERAATLTVTGNPLEIEWAHPMVDLDRDTEDWEVHVSAEYPSVMYHDSIRFLRQNVMPVLEAIDESLEATARDYHLIVHYGTAGNPFEGLVIQAAPPDTVVSYQVTLRPGADEEIQLLGDRLTLTATSRSRFEEAVERLLTLNGAWGPGLSGR